MAVPGSGTLSLLKLAKEKVYDDYNSGSSWPPSGTSGSGINLHELTVGGQAHSQTHVFEATNTAGSNAPNGDTPYRMSEFYSYDHDAVSSTTSYRTNSGFKYNVLCASNTTAAIYTVNAITNGSTVYTDSARTSVLASGKYGWHVNANSTQSTHRFYVDGSGVVSSFASC